MFKKLMRQRIALGLLLVIASILWIVKYTGKSGPPADRKSKEEVIIRTVGRQTSQPLQKVKKKLSGHSSQLNVVEVDPGHQEIPGWRKPKVSLPVPASIEQSVGNNEWISTTMYDSKAQCARAIQAQNDRQIKSNITCQIPKIDPFNPTMMKFIKPLPREHCSRYRSVGKLVDGKIHFTDSNVVSATYQEIYRSGDFNYMMGSNAPVSRSKRITDEFIEVDFRLRNGQHLRELFLQPVPHEHLSKRAGKRQPGIPMNILIVGIDSLSHANAIRKLPKVYEYLENELGAFIFNGHSIVGDGTTEQLAAMLTGQGEKEQYESRRHHRNPRPVDGWSWIYKELKDHGYITGYSGDAPAIGPFQYRLLGFRDPPTDMYTRPFFMRAARKLQGREHCLGSRNVAQTQFQYIRDVFHAFPEKLKFLFSFNVLFSHDDLNQVGSIEPDLVSLLQDLRIKGHVNDTLLILMGDHGFRMGEMRKQIQGKLEERLPLFSVVLPSWFAARYPKLAKNLRRNTKRLTSWYDVYATFRHMLSYPDAPAGLRHGQSLFLEVPTSRTCKQADVEQHWCPCQEWSAVDVTDSHVQNAALAAVEYMNSLNKEHDVSAQYCETLYLNTVNNAFVERPNDKLLAFQQTNDLIPQFSHKARPQHASFCRYQIQFETSPNNGVYEATVRYHLRWFIVSKSISRIDRYGDQPKCIARSLPHLRKFCLCREK